MTLVPSVWVPSSRLAGLISRLHVGKKVVGVVGRWREGGTVAACHDVGVLMGGTVAACHDVGVLIGIDSWCRTPTATAGARPPHPLPPPLTAPA